MHGTNRVLIAFGLLVLVGAAVTRFIAEPNSRAIATVQEGETPTARAVTEVVTQPADWVSDTRLKALEAELQALRRQLQSQTQTLALQQGEIARLSAVLDHEATSPELGDSEVQPPVESEEVQEEERVARIESELSKEPVDQAWSETAVEDISTTVTQAMEALVPEDQRGLLAFDADCRSTICRVELSYHDADTLQSLAREVPHRLGWQTTGTARIVSLPDGSSSAVVYLSRDGHTLPKPEI